MKAYALLGGPKNQWPSNIKEQLTAAKSKNDLIIGVDRGSLLLEQMGIIPGLALGDFDSLRPDELSEIEKTVADIRYSQPEKMLTDSELMLRMAFFDYQVSELVILGATGGRIDHLLVNLLMLLNPEVRPYAPLVSFVDKQNFLSFYNPGQHIVKKEAGFSYFGIFSLNKIENLNILGARYQLKNFNNYYPITFGSNEFLPGKDTMELTFTRGMIMVIQSRDQNRYQ